MSISQQDLSSLLVELPENQRDSAMKRILHADASGWRRIAIWVWFCTRRHEADLVGIRPDGEFRFLPWRETVGEQR